MRAKRTGTVMRPCTAGSRPAATTARSAARSSARLPEERAIATSRASASVRPSSPSLFAHQIRPPLSPQAPSTVVTDGTAAATTPDLGDGYAAALTNFRFMANAVIDTESAVASMSTASK